MIDWAKAITPEAVAYAQKLRLQEATERIKRDIHAVFSAAKAKVGAGTWFMEEEVAITAEVFAKLDRNRA